MEPKATILEGLLLALPLAVHAATFRLDSTQTYKKAGTLPVGPGDTICLAEGRRPYQYLQGISGTAQQPVVVTNCPQGPALVGPAFRYGLWLDSVAFVRITGGLSPAIPHGIHIDGTSSGSGLSVTGNSHHVEIDHLEISGTDFAGIMVKQDYGGNPPDPWPVFTGLSIHHNHVHHTGGEGMYLGETKSPGQYFREVAIHHNLIRHTGWDLMQVANMDGVEISHNVMVDGGVLREPVQQNGFQIGDNTRRLRFHHNVVAGTGANSAIVMGSGSIALDSNWFSGAKGDQALFVDNRSLVDTGTTISIRDNFWSSDSVARMWSVYNEHNLVVLEGNRLSPDIPSIRYASGAGPANTTLSGNLTAPIAPLSFADSSRGDFHLAKESPYAPWNFGFGAADEAAVRSRSGIRTSLPADPTFHRLKPAGLPLDIPHPQGRASR